MSVTYLPPFVTLHLPDGTDRHLYGRVSTASGSSGLKGGSHAMAAGKTKVVLDNRDGFIGYQEEAELSAAEVEASSISVGAAGIPCLTAGSGRWWWTLRNGSRPLP